MKGHECDILAKCALSSLSWVGRTEIEYACGCRCQFQITGGTEQTILTNRASERWRLVVLTPSCTNMQNTKYRVAESMLLSVLRANRPLVLGLERKSAVMSGALMGSSLGAQPETDVPPNAYPSSGQSEPCLVK